jgi:hypothetical protein
VVKQSRRATVAVITHVWASDVARTICDKASSWCGNRNAIEEADGVSEVTAIVHLSSKRLYASNL